VLLCNTQAVAGEGRRPGVHRRQNWCPNRLHHGLGGGRRRTAWSPGARRARVENALDAAAAERNGLVADDVQRQTGPPSAVASALACWRRSCSASSVRPGGWPTRSPGRGLERSGRATWRSTRAAPMQDRGRWSTWPPLGVVPGQAAGRRTVSPPGSRRPRCDGAAPARRCRSRRHRRRGRGPGRLRLSCVVLATHWC
jgi:hypothetical protein